MSLQQEAVQSTMTEVDPVTSPSEISVHRPYIVVINRFIGLCVLLRSIVRYAFSLQTISPLGPSGQGLLCARKMMNPQWQRNMDESQYLEPIGKTHALCASSRLTR